MRRINLFHTFIALIICFLFYKDGHTQTKIQHSVFGNGGAILKNGDFHLNGTIGQPIIGSIGSTSDSIRVGFWYTSADFMTSIKQATTAVPTMYRLEQNYPNPFNQTTIIDFSLPENSSVTLKLFDVLGRNVATLVDDEFQAGTYKVVFDAKDLPSGVYVYQLWTDNFVQHRKLILMK